VSDQPDIRAMMRYDANKKSALIAYLLWFFLGYFGIHRFYLGHTVSAVVMLLIGLLSVPLTFVAVGAAGFGIIGIWWLIDAVLIPGMTRRYNNRLIARLGG
jgi:TM2 domain-containing membrane protein YozV